MIGAVIFDFSGVIVSRINNIAENLSLFLKKEKSEIHNMMKGKHFNDFIEGKITEEQFWKIVVNKESWPLSLEELKKTSRESFSKIPGTIEIIEELKSKNIKMGILSSHSKEWTEFLREKIGHEKYFDKTLYSYQVGIAKPNIEFYKKIVEKLNVLPEVCIYIDDKEKYLRPAKKLGMKTILFRNPEQLRIELTSAGVLEPWKK